MKIFNEENGIKKVYVQLCDIGMLLHSDEVVPLSVYKCLKDIRCINEYNRFLFVEFTDNNEIEFFKSISWILDFKKYKNLTENKLLDRLQLVEEKMEDIAREYKKQAINEGIRNDELMLKYDCIEYMGATIYNILSWKKGLIDIPFPEVVDNDASYVIPNDEIPFRAYQGINPCQLIIGRTDGLEMIKEKGIIPEMFFQAAEVMIIENNMENNEFFKIGDVRRKLSDDKKKLIVTYKIAPIIEEKKSIIASLKKLFNKITMTRKNK